MKATIHKLLNYQGSFWGFFAVPIILFALTGCFPVQNAAFHLTLGEKENWTFSGNIQVKLKDSQALLKIISEELSQYSFIKPEINILTADASENVTVKIKISGDSYDQFKKVFGEQSILTDEKGNLVLKVDLTRLAGVVSSTEFIVSGRPIKSHNGIGAEKNSVRWENYFGTMYAVAEQGGIGAAILAWLKTYSFSINMGLACLSASIILLLVMFGWPGYKVFQIEIENFVALVNRVGRNLKSDLGRNPGADLPLPSATIPDIQMAQQAHVIGSRVDGERQTFFCSECGAQLPDEPAIFCPECGARRQEIFELRQQGDLHSEAPLATIRCLNCGTAMPDGALFCPECGAQPQEAFALEQQAGLHPETSLAKVRCLNCGIAIPDNAVFCPECGQSTSTSSDHTLIKMVSQKEIENCPQCGWGVPGNAAFCPECGSQIKQRS